MQNLSVTAAISSLLLLGAACSDDTGAPDTGAPDTGAPDTGAPDAVKPQDASADIAVDSAPDGGAGDAGATITITGGLVDFITAAAVDGVNVCVLDTPSVPCVKTDSAGSFTLPGVPDGQDVLISMKKTGYISYAVPHGAGQLENNYSLSLLSDSVAAAMTGALGTTVKAGKGHIIFSVGGLNPEGTTVTLDKVSGEGPFYMGPFGMPDPTLTATSPFGVAFLANIDPGDYELTFANSGGTCSLTVGWPGSASDKTKVKVLADTAITPIASCQ